MSEELIVKRIWTNRWTWQAALPIALSTLNEVVAERARKMWLQGPPLLLLKRVERGNGFEACRLLVERYDGANASRLHHTQGSIMRPKAFPPDGGRLRSGFE